MCTIAKEQACTMPRCGPGHGNACFVIRAYLFAGWAFVGLALLSSIFEVSDFIIGPHHHDLPAFLLNVSYIAISEFRTPLVSRGVVTFYIVEGSVRMNPRHVLSELRNMTFHNDASLTFRLVGFGSLRR